MDSSKTNVILGPPGTGKTERLLSIVEEALGSGTPPNRIGFVSFTKKAAEEGKTRAAEKFSINPDDLVNFKTLHAFAFRYLGMRRDQMLGWQHIRELGKMLGLEFKGRGEVAEDDVYGMAEADRLLFLEGLSRNTKRPLKDIWTEAFEDSINWWELERFSKALSLFKKNRTLSDFNDLIERFCLASPSTLPKFDVLLVDESQDNSPLQWDAVELLATNAKQIFIAGDDCQAVYKWSGADVDRFINMPGNQMTLNQSYRIPSAVHKLADSLSNLITNKRARFWKPREEVGQVNWFNSIEEVDLSKDTWLLLARNGYMLDELENWCMSQGFPFHSVNRDPLKSHSLDAIKIWENLRKGGDESAERLLLVSRFIDSRMLPAALLKRFKADDPGRMYGLPELQSLGLGTTAIWHVALSKISPKEREFFIAVRRRNEPLLREPRIKISTIHAAKGGQADHVLLVTDMSLRCYNNMQNNFDDEVRVWYVASTRCRKTLNLITPRTNLNFEF